MQRTRAGAQRRDNRLQVIGQSLGTQKSHIKAILKFQDHLFQPNYRTLVGSIAARVGRLVTYTYQWRGGGTVAAFGKADGKDERDRRRRG
jgi:hypothetical protein